MISCHKTEPQKNGVMPLCQFNSLCGSQKTYPVIINIFNDSQLPISVRKDQVIQYVHYIAYGLAGVRQIYCSEHDKISFSGFSARVDLFTYQYKKSVIQPLCSCDECTSLPDSASNVLMTPSTTLMINCSQWIV